MNSTPHFSRLQKSVCLSGSLGSAAGKRPADCWSHCRRRSRRPPSPHRRHRDADALLLAEKGSVTRDRWSSSAPAVGNALIGCSSAPASTRSSTARNCSVISAERNSRASRATIRRLVLVQAGDVVGADRGACVHKDRVVGVVDRGRLADCPDPAKAAVRREHPISSLLHPRGGARSRETPCSSAVAPPRRSLPHLMNPRPNFGS